MHTLLLCIAVWAALGTVGERRAEARRLPSLSIREAAIGTVPPPLPPLPPRWLEPPPDRTVESVWGVPSAFLKGVFVDRTPLALGRIDVQGRSIRIRVDGQLRLGSTDIPLLGGRLALDVNGHHYDVPLPWLQILPRHQNNLLYAEVGIVLWDRRF